MSVYFWSGFLVVNIVTLQQGKGFVAFSRSERYLVNKRRWGENQKKVDFSAFFCPKELWNGFSSLASTNIVLLAATSHVLQN